MVHFTETLERLKNPEWAQHYIDYQDLCRQLSKLREAYNREAERADNDQAKAMKTGSNEQTQLGDTGLLATGSVSHNSIQLWRPMKYLRSKLSVESFDLEENLEIEELEESFAASLETQVERASSFFVRKQGELKNEFLGIRARSVRTRATGTSGGDASVGLVDMQSQYESLGDKTLCLIRFLRLNVEALEKVLGRHDEQIRQLHVPKYCSTSQARAKFSYLRELDEHKGFLSIVKGLRNAIDATEGSRADDIDPLAQPRESGGCVSDMDLGLTRLQLRDNTLGVTGGKRIRSSVCSPTLRSILNAIAEEQGTLTAVHDQSITKFLSLGVLPAPRECAFEEDEELADHAKLELDYPSVFIALMTTFVDMANYYIAEPAASRYAAALGASPATSGLIIGMTPLAGCVSCVFFSWWTNSSFKSPLLLCTSLLLIGNLLYGLAISFDAYWMVLVGRILIGFGGTRGVSRRYITGNVPTELRTVYSAAFVASGSLGMAFGPLVAILADSVQWKVDALEFNGLTNPGWIMSCCWLSLGLLILLKFKEPSQKRRSDTDEKQRKPSKCTGSASSVSVATTCDVESSTSSFFAATVPLGTPINSYGTMRSSNSDGSVSLGHTWSTAAGGTSNEETSRRGLDVPDRGEGGQDEERLNLLGASGADARDIDTRRGAKVGSRKLLGEERLKLLGMSGAGAQDVQINGGTDVWPQTPLGPSPGAGGDNGDEDGEESICSEEYIPPSTTTPPLLFCLFGFFVNKLVSEVAVSSTPVLAGYMLEWSVADVGTMMAILGLTVLPINIFVGRLSLVVDDRLLLQILAILAGVGCMLIIISPFMPFWYMERQYICGVCLIFAALQAHEGVTMSITSKITPARLARSTYHSGFLATGVGTFGRLLGDVAITLGGLITLEWLEVLLFTPAVLLIASMGIGFWVVYPYLGA